MTDNHDTKAPSGAIRIMRSNDPGTIPDRLDQIESNDLARLADELVVMARKSPGSGMSPAMVALASLYLTGRPKGRAVS
jgi:hypothetical protein